MQGELIRYSKIDAAFKREFVLLQGKGCVWKKCRFCDYYLDVSNEPYELNRSVLANVTGEYGVLDVINSGSVFELDDKTLDLIRSIAVEKNIHTIWFEVHWLYHKRLPEMRKRFGGIELKFRIGAETFDTRIRNEWQKGIPEAVTPAKMAEYFDGCCLLVCVEGQSRGMILNDIETADKYFSYCSINVFAQNSKDLKRDQQLVDWFCREVVPKYENNPKFEILINNTDLGVG